MTEKLLRILTEYEIYELMAIFFAYSVAGWLVEVLRRASAGKDYVRAGVCSGPWCGIYGLGAMLVIASKALFGGGPVYFFAYGLAIGTVLQLFNRLILKTASKGQTVPGFRWHNPLLWGACGTILICHLHPLFMAGLTRVHPMILLAVLLIFWFLYPGQVIDGLSALGKDGVEAQDEKVTI